MRYEIQLIDYKGYDGYHLHYYGGALLREGTNYKYFYNGIKQLYHNAIPRWCGSNKIKLIKLKRVKI